MAKPAPHGPLLGDELGWAIELLSDKQLRAYSYFREGQHTMGWIATRMGTSRQAVIPLVVKAERKLGYELSFTPKQKLGYKPVAHRRAEAQSVWDTEAGQAIGSMSRTERRRSSGPWIRQCAWTTSASAKNNGFS